MKRILVIFICLFVMLTVISCSPPDNGKKDPGKHGGVKLDPKGINLEKELKKQEKQK
jgi:hypothetical protein